MAKIAVALQQALARRALNGEAGHLASRVLAQGPGWIVQDVLCTSGPQDHPFEEQHSGFNIVVVLAGTFQYRAALPGSRRGTQVMTPGSILLGNAGQHFECGHEHGTGDRCLSFWYAPDYFERLAADTGIRRGTPEFRVLRLPPIRALSPLIVRATAWLGGSERADSSNFSRATNMPWEELSLQLVAQAMELVWSLSPQTASPSASSVARVTRAVRMIEHCQSQQPDLQLGLGELAREAGLSPYHFLRVFERLTDVTPHQYVLRTRLRQTATRLVREPAKILDIAFDSGFGDLSTFNRAFRAEFGMSPRHFRLRAGGRSSKDCT